MNEANYQNWHWYETVQLNVIGDENNNHDWKRRETHGAYS